MKQFVNKSLGKRCIVYLLKLYYNKLPDVEIDLVILKMFMSPPHVQFNFLHTGVIVVSIIVVLMFCHKYFSVFMKHGTRKLKCNLHVTEKLTINHCFWSYTQLQTVPALKHQKNIKFPHCFFENLSLKTHNFS